MVPWRWLGVLGLLASAGAWGWCQGAARATAAGRVVAARLDRTLSRVTAHLDSTHAAAGKLQGALARQATAARQALDVAHRHRLRGDSLDAVLAEATTARDSIPALVALVVVERARGDGLAAVGRQAVVVAAAWEAEVRRLDEQVVVAAGALAAARDSLQRRAMPVPPPHRCVLLGLPCPVVVAGPFLSVTGLRVGIGLGFPLRLRRG